ncbi:MerR family transcriptional regulator, partial [Streptomyces sp. S6]
MHLRTPVRAQGEGGAVGSDAFLALVPGHGHRTAAAIMRAVNEGADDEAFRLIDAS